MDELLTTQQAGIAAILAALALVLHGVARLVMAGGEHVGPIGRALVDLIRAFVEGVRAWTRRTTEERDCAPKLAAALKHIEGLLRRVEDLELANLAAGHDDLTTHIVEARGDEATGDPRLPPGVPERRKKVIR